MIESTSSLALHSFPRPSSSTTCHGTLKPSLVLINTFTNTQLNMPNDQDLDVAI
jgi:hypothetical protein